MTIQKVAVIGSGVMGSGIAAQIANAGIPVLLLDIVPKDTPKNAAGTERNKLPLGAIERLKKMDPAPLMSTRNASLITAGNLEDDLDLLKECDWIIEVVLEDLEIKHATYKKISTYRKDGAVVSSNTSTIPLSKLVEPFDKEFRKNFLITHFFNPPRYMRLMELVVGKETDPQCVEIISRFCDEKLGKGVVLCHDTPGFIANRLGVFWLTAAINTAIEESVPIEIADSILSKPVGIPKTGVFGLIDLIGIDLMPHLAKSLLSTLPKEDPYRSLFKDHSFIHEMIKNGYTGRKGKGGFYRINAQKEKQALRFKDDKFDESFYQKVQKQKLDSVSAGKNGLRAVLDHPDIGGRYAWKVLQKTLAYAASLVPEITDTIANVDEAMRLGYNWKQGPFEMLDAIGPSWFANKLKDSGLEVPKILQDVGDRKFYRVEDGILQYFGTDSAYHNVIRPEGVLLLSDVKRRSSPLIKTPSASVWDIGDGVLCVEFTGKMNALDGDVFEAYAKASALILASQKTGDDLYKAMIIYNEGSAFSAGANLGMALFSINSAMWGQVEEMVSGGQNAYKALKYAPFPVVAAPSGLALGGGCEILLHADHVQAHAELYCGLVEVGVGLIPAWGGCKEILLRHMKKDGKKAGPMPAVRKAFETIAQAKMAKSAQEAKELLYLRDNDGITMNRDRLLFDAKQKALSLAKGYKPPEAETEIRLPGPSGKLALDIAVSDLKKAGKATRYDVVVSQACASVLTGGTKGDITVSLTEDDLYSLEREEFMKLIRNEETADRIQHMLDTGKPLRN